MISLHQHSTKHNSYSTPNIEVLDCFVPNSTIVFFSHSQKTFDTPKLDHCLFFTLSKNTKHNSYSTPNIEVLDCFVLVRPKPKIRDFN